MLQRILCAIGFHDWDKWRQKQIHHMGEPPWETWQHICLGWKRSCKQCGTPSRLQVTCDAPRLSLPNQT